MDIDLKRIKSSTVWRSRFRAILPDHFTFHH